MTLIRKNRNAAFPALLDELFNQDASFYHRNNLPAVNIKESDEGFQLEMAAPGLKKENFQLEVKENTLTVSSKEEEKKEEVKENYTRKEFSFKAFKRSFNLPKNVDQDNISAKYNEGVINISIPRKAEAVPAVKQIEIA